MSLLDSCFLKTEVCASSKVTVASKTSKKYHSEVTRDNTLISLLLWGFQFSSVCLRPGNRVHCRAPPTEDEGVTSWLASASAFPPEHDGWLAWRWSCLSSEESHNWLFPYHVPICTDKWGLLWSMSQEDFLKPGQGAPLLPESLTWTTPFSSISA